MKVFLTGGTGFIGQPLTQELLGRGWDVTVLVRKPTSAQALAIAKMGAACVAGDVTDRESMRAAMSGADIVIHNAGWYEIGVSQAARKKMREINVNGTDNVLSLALELGIPRIVYTSTILYYGDTGTEVRDESYQRQTPPRSYYEQSKSEAHEIALHYAQRGLPLIIVCPATVFGPNDHSLWGYFLRTYLNHLLPPFAWSPETPLTGVQVEDVAAGITLAAEKGRVGESYILAGARMTLREIVAIWGTKPGHFRVRFYLPTWLVWLLFIPMEVLLRLMGLPAFMSRETIAATVPLAFSSAKAQRELGWSYRPAQTIWHETINEEIRLLTSRQKRDLVSRLKAVEVVETANGHTDRNMAGNEVVSSGNAAVQK